MKKTILSTVLLSSVLLGGLVVNAAVDPADKDQNRHAETDVNVTLKDDGPDQENGPFSGSLAFVYKPTAYNFSGKVTNNTGSKIELVNTKKHYDKNIVVNDDRRDDSDNLIDSKWKLTAAFKLTGEEKLNGAVLSLTPNSAYLYDIGEKFEVKEGVRDIVPNPAPKVIAGDSELSGVTTSPVALPADGDAQLLMSSDIAATPENKSTKDRGAYTNLSDAKLVVASDNKAGSYTGKVLWSLSSTY